MKCKICGFENPDGFKFCGKCGSKLEESILTGNESINKKDAKEIGERRNLCVMFVDISGFTKLSLKYDPEDLRNLIERVFKRLGKIIYKYEGYIDKIIGDAIMALFGAPIAHEDDPLRSVMAAFDLLKEIKKISQEENIPLDLSIGINKGLVVTGYVPLKNSYTVMGSEVNLAERLQSAAPKGSIYVGESIKESTKKEVVYKKIRIKVKGYPEPIDVFEPIEIKSKSIVRSGKRRIFYNREKELAVLHDWLLQDKTQIFSIIGDAGVGKTTLIYKAIENIKNEYKIFYIKGIEYLKKNPYTIVREVLYNILEISGKDLKKLTSAEESVDKFFKDSGLIKAPTFIKWFLSLKISSEEKLFIESIKPEEIEQIVTNLLSFMLTKLKDENVLFIFDDLHWHRYMVHYEDE